ncbi:MAG: hypothetical protein JO326_13280 [Acetobacteraceae bacterium]|nr:hypothetical protein [Acetobacteraceae bacterium]
MTLHTAVGARKYLTTVERDAFLRAAEQADRKVRTPAPALASRTSTSGVADHARSSNTAAALHGGEVDWVEQPVMDLVPSLRKNARLRVEVVETTGLIGVLRFNQSFPPFDNAQSAAPR